MNAAAQSQDWLEVSELVEAFIACQSWGDSYKFLLRHPRLRDQKAVNVLARERELAEERGDAERAKVTHFHGYLLSRARQGAAEAGFVEVAGQELLNNLAYERTWLNVITSTPKPSPGPLAAFLVSSVSTHTGYDFLASHPEALSESCAQAIDAMMDAASSRGHNDLASYLERWSKRLRRSMAIGLEDAFYEDQGLAFFTPRDLIQHTERLAAAEEAYHASRSRRDLDQVVELGRAIRDSSEYAAATPTYQAKLTHGLAQAVSQRYQEYGDSADALYASELSKAVPSPRLSPRWPELTTDAGDEMQTVLDRAAFLCSGGLQRFETFHPFGVALWRDGRVTVTTDPLLTSGDVDPLFQLHRKAVADGVGLKAVAIVHGTGQESLPLMSIHCEHRVGRAFQVTIQWERLVDDNVRLKAPAIEPAARLLWC